MSRNSCDVYGTSRGTAEVNVTWQLWRRCNTSLLPENMAALKVAVLLAVLGSVSLALQLPFSKGTFSRIRRQLPSPQCQQDYLDLSSNGCFTLFGEGSTSVTVENARQFCRDGCPATLDGLFKKLISDCGEFARVSELATHSVSPILARYFQWLVSVTRWESKMCFSPCEGVG